VSGSSSPAASAAGAADEVATEVAAAEEAAAEVLAAGAGGALGERARAYPLPPLAPAAQR